MTVVIERNTAFTKKKIIRKPPPNPFLKKGGKLSRSFIIRFPDMLGRDI